MNVSLPRRRSGGVRHALREARDVYRRTSRMPDTGPPVAARAATVPPDVEAASDVATHRMALPAVPRPGRLRAAAARRLRGYRVGRGEPDVFLDVPALHVERLGLEVDELRARVALEARVLDMVRLDVGADVSLGRVRLDIEGVDARAQLKVRLEHLEAIVERVMDTVDRNPQLLEGLTRSLGATVERLGDEAGRAVGALGEGTGRALDGIGEAAGRVVDDAAGRVVGDLADGAARVVGDLADGAARANGAADRPPPP
jgi:hypothetical protein